MALHRDTVWEVRRTGNILNGGGWISCAYPSAVVIAAGGAGYNPADVLTLVGGTDLGQAAQYRVDAVDGGGGVTAVSLLRATGYTAPPANPVATTVVPPGGAGCTLTLTWTATTDYSQQDAAQLHLLDGAMGAGLTTLTSAGGGFTAAMIGNVLYINAGAGFTVSRYQIVGWNTGNSIELDRTAAAGGGVAGDVYVGGAYNFHGGGSTFITTHVVAGNTVHVGPGDYTPTAALGVQAGTATAAVKVIGYHSTRGDTPTGDDRPHVTGRQYNANGYSFHANLRVTFGGNGAIVSNQGWCLFYNCLATQTTVAAGQHAFTLANYDVAVGCEAVTAGTGNSRCFYVPTSSFCIGCYAHDAPEGFVLANTGAACFLCVADTLSNYGYYLGTTACLVVNCSAYACLYGVYASNSAMMAVINCAFEGCTTDIWNNQAATQEHNYTVHNCCGGVTPFRNVLNYIGNLLQVPGFQDPAAGDFSVRKLDPVYQAAAEADRFTSCKLTK